MANIYWVGGSGTWNTTSVTNWANASGGTGGTGTVPTAADNVFFDQAGTYTVTMTGALLCLNITVSAGTVTFAAGTSPTLAISGSMSIIAGTAWSYTGVVTFNATTAKTISTNGITIDSPVTFNGVAGSWQLLSAFTIGSTRTATLTNGTLDLNNFTFTCGLFSSTGATSRTLAFGTSGQLALTGNNNTIFSTATATNFLTTGTVYVNCTYTGGVGTRTFTSGFVESQALVFGISTSGTSGIVLSPTATDTIVLNNGFGSLNLTGFNGTLGGSARTIYGNLTLPASGGTYSASTSATTFASTSGVKAITTNGRTLDFPIIFNGTGGNWQLQDALTIGSTRTTQLVTGNLDLFGYTLTTGLFSSNVATARNIAFGVGGNITVTGNSLTSLDIGNATSLTLIYTPIFQVTNATSSGVYMGTTAGYFTEANSLSVFGGSSTGSAGIYVTSAAALALSGNFKNIDLTGFAGSINNAVRNIYGNLTIPSSGVSFASGTTVTTFAATSGTKTISSNGVTLDFPITFNGVGGTWQLQSALTVGSTRATTLTNGSLDVQSYTLTTGTFVSNGSTTRSIVFSTGNITAAGASTTAVDMSSGTGLTLTGTPIFQLTNATTNGALIGTTAGYFTEANSLSAFAGASTGAAGIYFANASTTLAGVFKTINLTGFTGTLTNSARTVYGDLTIPASGATLTAGTSTTTFAATSGTKLINSNGVTLDFPITFSGIGGTWQLQSALTVGTTRTTTLTNGTIDLQSYTLTTGLFSSSASSTRTIAFGTGNITVNGTGTVWTTSTVTGFTITGTPVVNVSNNTATAATVTPGALSEANSISFNFTTGTYALSFLNTASNTAKNVNFTGFSGTWGATSTGTIYGNLTISSGMTLTASTSALTFGATSGTKTITSNGKTLDFPVTFNGIGGTWQIQDNLNLASTRTLTLTNGTFDLNNLTASTGLLSSSGSTARTLAFGTSGQLAVSGNNTTILTLATTTNLSTTGTVYINCTYTGATGTRTISSGLSESQSTSFGISTSGTSGIVLSPSATDTIALTGSFGAIDFTGFTGTLSNTVRTLYGNLTLPASGGTYTAGTTVTTLGGTSGTKTITSNGRTLDFPVAIDAAGAVWQLQDAFNLGSTRLLIFTNGTIDLQSYTLTTGIFSSSNSNTRTIAFGTGNITVNGTGPVWSTTTSTNLTISGSKTVNVSNNTATAATVYTGLATEANAFSFNITSGTYTLTLSTSVSKSYVNNLNFNGFSGYWSSDQSYIYGDLTFSSSMTTADLTSTYLVGTSKTQNITSNGNAQLKSSFYFSGSGSTYKLLDALTSFPSLGGYKSQLSNGTLDLNGFTMTIREFDVYGTNAKSLKFSGGQLVISGGNNSVYNCDSATNYTIADIGTISFTSSSTKNIYANNISGTISHSNVTLNNGGAGELYVSTNGCSWNDITATYFPTSFRFVGNKTQTVNNLTLHGLPGQLVSILLDYSSARSNISQSSGIVSCDYLNITGNNAIGGATFYAGSHSVNSGNNSGWIFSDPPVPSTNTGNMFLMF
jgi:hypothetical protein